MRKVKKADLPRFFDQVSSGMDLFLPLKEGGVCNFGLYRKGAAFDLESTKSVKSPKDVFFPQCETLYRVQKGEDGFDVEPGRLKEQDFCVFGIRPCDLKALSVLDRVFLSEPVDSFYRARREHGILLSLACHRPAKSCFCTAFEIDPSVCAGADAAMYLIGEELFIEAQSRRGEDFLEAFSGCLSEAEDSALIEEEKEAIRKILKKLPYADLTLTGWGPGKTMERFDDPLWGPLSDACLACGACTYVCPTCQCYDIRDFDTGSGVLRYRCWDSCMVPDFTLMAGGNNRTSQLQRFRQRFMHKLVYYPENQDGLFMCVGCGRCTERCPQSLHIVKVIRSVQKEGGTGFDS